MSYEKQVSLRKDEEEDYPQLSESLDQLVRGEMSFEDMQFLLISKLRKSTTKKAKGVHKSEHELAALITAQRMRQLIQKFLASAVVKEGKLDMMRKTLNDVKSQQAKAEATVEKKRAAIAVVRSLQTELAKALEAVSADVQTETGRVNEAAAKAQAVVQEKEKELELAKRRLAAVSATVEEHRATLRQLEEALRAIRSEEALQRETAEHRQLMAELEAELQADMAAVQEEFERVRAHIVETTTDEIQNRVANECGEELTEVERQDNELTQRLYAEALALRAAREKLELLKIQSRNKDSALLGQVATFEQRVEAEVQPLREAIEQLREEVFESKVHEERKAEMEAELARLEEELANLTARLKEKDEEMEATEQQFEDLLADVRKEKQRKLDLAKEEYENFKEEIAPREEKVAIGIQERKAVEEQADLKRQQVENLYERIQQLEAGLRLKSQELDLLQREIANTNESARVQTEEVFLAEKLSAAAVKESDIKKELQACLEEKMAILARMRENVEAASAVVKGEGNGGGAPADEAREALEKTRALDNRKIAVLNQEIKLRTSQIEDLKKLVKTYRDEITALEKVRTAMERGVKASLQLKTHLQEQLEWLANHKAECKKQGKMTSELALVPRLEWAVKALDTRIKDTKSISYATEDRLKASKWHSELLETRLKVQRRTLEALETEKTVSNEQLEMLDAEIANIEQEMNVETQRQTLLEKEVVSFTERSGLLQEAAKNAESEMRLHKLSAGVWQGKIKVIREETKVREQRAKQVDQDVGRLEDLKALRQSQLDMLVSLHKNYMSAIELNEKEKSTLETQHEAIETRASLSI